MATVASTPSGFMGFVQGPLGRNLALGAGLALVLGIMAAVFLWGQKPNYKVLLSNYSDRDGGAIIAQLQQMNIPYQFSDGGNAILVPAEMVYDARLKLAAQGLPRGGNVGFELMENEKMGTSQFVEQVNYHRALEGELARTISSIGAVQAARVHLAIPKQSVFVREKQLPTASVLVNLNAGRTLDKQQVKAVIHLVSSSVPELSPSSVTVVDQTGQLLSGAKEPGTTEQLDPEQMKYVKEVQDNIKKRIEAILTPMLGEGNVQAQATADIDFSRSEQATEVYQPNATPESSSVRSLHTTESASTDTSSSVATGIPGAASNQASNQARASNRPGAKPVAPKASSNTLASNAPIPPNNTQKDNTVNYELNKTVNYTAKPMGGIKRLTVAVVVNNKKEVDDKGKATYRPLTNDEKNQVTTLVKDAMGFNQERGDSVNVVNTLFTEPEVPEIPEEPFWKPYATVSNAKEIGQYLITGIVLFLLYSKALKPLIARLKDNEQSNSFSAEEDTIVNLNSSAVNPSNNAPPPILDQSGNPIANPTPDQVRQSRIRFTPKASKDNLVLAQEMVQQDPKVVAGIIKKWVNESE